LVAKTSYLSRKSDETSLWNLFELVIEPTDFGRVSLQIDPNWIPFFLVANNGKKPYE